MWTIPKYKTDGSLSSIALIATNVAISLKNKTGLHAVQESLVIIMWLNLVRIWKENLGKYGWAISKSFLVSVFTIAFGVSILFKN